MDDIQTVPLSKPGFALLARHRIICHEGKFTGQSLLIYSLGRPTSRESEDDILYRGIPKPLTRLS